MSTILNQDKDSIVKSIDVESIVSDYLDKERRRAIRGTFSKPKEPFYLVNDRFRTLLSKQITQTLEVKQAVIKKALNDVKGISRDNYLSKLRDVIFNRLLSNFMFLRDCLNLGLNPFVAAQNIAMSGLKQADKVLIEGINVAYKEGGIDSLKDEIFTEQELALAKFSSVTNTASELQLHEADRLISAMKKVLNLLETEQK